MAKQIDRADFIRSCERDIRRCATEAAREAMAGYLVNALVWQVKIPALLGIIKMAKAKQPYEQTVGVFELRRVQIMTMLPESWARVSDVVADQLVPPMENTHARDEGMWKQEHMGEFVAGVDPAKGKDSTALVFRNHKNRGKTWEMINAAGWAMFDFAWKRIYEQLSGFVVKPSDEWMREAAAVEVGSFIVAFEGFDTPETAKQEAQARAIETIMQWWKQGGRTGDAARGKVPVCAHGYRVCRDVSCASCRLGEPKPAKPDQPIRGELTNERKVAGKFAAALREGVSKAEDLRRQGFTYADESYWRRTKPLAVIGIGAQSETWLTREVCDAAAIIVARDIPNTTASLGVVRHAAEDAIARIEFSIWADENGAHAHEAHRVRVRENAMLLLMKRLKAWGYTTEPDEKGLFAKMSFATNAWDDGCELRVERHDGTKLRFERDNHESTRQCGGYIVFLQGAKNCSRLHDSAVIIVDERRDPGTTNPYAALTTFAAWAAQLRESGANAARVIVGTTVGGAKRLVGAP